MKQLVMLWLVVIGLAGCGDEDNPLLDELMPQADKKMIVETLLDTVEEDYQTLAGSAASLHDAMVQFCAAPDAPGLVQLQSMWQQTQLNYARLQWVDFGPVTAPYHFVSFASSISLWPDKTAPFVASQVDSRLGDDSVITIETIASGSAALRGLPALEYLLFGDGETLPLFVNDTSGRRCALLLAIAENVQYMTGEIAGRWPEYRSDLDTQLMQPEGLETVIDQLVNGVLFMLERTKNTKLLAPMNPGGGEARPEWVETYFSQFSLEVIRENVVSARDFYQGKGASAAGFDDFIRDNLNLPLTDRQIQFAFEDVEAVLDTIEHPLEVVLASPNTYSDDYGRLVTLSERLTDLVKAIKYDLTRAMDVQVGFNADDGD